MSKSEVKQTRVTLQIDEDEKWFQEQLAKRHGLSYSGLLRKGARFYGSLTPGFIDDVGRTLADLDLGITVGVFLEHTVQRLIASQKAFVNIFGYAPPGTMRQFPRHDDGKLIKGDDLSKILEHEYTELFQQLKDNMVESVEKDEPFEVTKEQAFEVMALR